MKNLDAPQWSSGNASYGDLRAFVANVRAALRAAPEPQVAQAQVGLLFIGWHSIYKSTQAGGAFAERQPQMYDAAAGHYLNQTAPLQRDAYAYASQPGGARDGQTLHSLLASQWAALCAFFAEGGARVDTVMVRDGLSTYANYNRLGPFGGAASPSAEANARWRQAFANLFAAFKAGRDGNMTVLGYSQAGSALGEWLVGLTDVRAAAGIVVEGKLGSGDARESA